MKVAVQGLRNDVRWPPLGGELNVSDREGAELCALGYAEPVVAEPEKPAAPKPERRKRA